MKIPRQIDIRVLALALLIPLTTFSQAPDSTNSLARKWRQNAVMGEVGLNSLASLIGITCSYYFRPDMAIDLGYGKGEYGLRPGIRYRYLFYSEDFSPFLGAEFKYSFGGGQADEPVFGFSDTGGKLLRLKSAAFLDFCAGTDYQARNGFMFLGAFGWSFHLGGRSYEAAYTSDSQSLNYKADDLVFGSGPLVSVALGYAFKQL